MTSPSDHDDHRAHRSPRGPYLCLHCVLPAFIDEFRRQNPQKSATDVIGELAQVLGEYIGSAAFNSGHTDCVLQIVTGASRHVLENAYLLIAELKRRKQ